MSTTQKDRRSWASPRQATLALRRSWTSWSRKRATRRQDRKRAKQEQRLAPLLEILLPIALHLETQQEQIERLLVLTEGLTQRPAPEPTTPPETRELLLEILQTMQPPPEQAIFQQLGLRPRVPSSPSSVS